MSTSSTGKLPTSISNDTISVNEIAWPVDREIPKLEWELPHGVRVVSSDDHTEGENLPVTGEHRSRGTVRPAKSPLHRVVSPRESAPPRAASRP